MAKIKIDSCITLYFKQESQNFLKPGLAKPKSQLNLGFRSTDLGYI